MGEMIVFEAEGTYFVTTALSRRTAKMLEVNGRRNDLRTIVVIGAKTKNRVGKLSIAMFFPCLPVFFLPCSRVRPVLACYSSFNPNGFIAEK
jgi:hypothetical protein